MAAGSAPTLSAIAKARPACSGRLRGLMLFYLASHTQQLLHTSRSCCLFGGWKAAASGFSAVSTAASTPSRGPTAFVAWLSSWFSRN